MAYINKKEQEALSMASDQFSTIIEACDAGGNSRVIKDLNFVKENLDSLYRKSFRK